MRAGVYPPRLPARLPGLFEGSGGKQPLQSYPWSSYPVYLQEPAKRPVWLRVDRLLGEWGIAKDSAAGREELAGRMEARRRAEGAGEYEPQGWYWGREEFRQELLAQVNELATPQDGGEEIRQSALAKAQRIAEEELSVPGWTDWTSIAWRLRFGGFLNRSCARQGGGRSALRVITSVVTLRAWFWN